jgi:hypothetical protein
LPVQVFSNSMGQNALGPEGITERTQAVFLQGTYDLGGLSEMLDGLKYRRRALYVGLYVEQQF